MPFVMASCIGLCAKQSLFKSNHSLAALSLLVVFKVQFTYLDYIYLALAQFRDLFISSSPCFKERFKMAPEREEDRQTDTEPHSLTHCKAQ